MIKAFGKAIVVDGKTGKRHLVAAADLDWELPDREARETGQGCVFIATCHLGGLSPLRWEVTEYPYGSVQNVTFNATSAHLEEDFSFRIDLEQNESD